MKVKEKVLVVAVHPDDETLGAGGTILKHVAAGDEVAWCIVTCYGDDVSKEIKNKREKEIEQVKKIYCFKNVYKMGVPTTTVDQISDQVLVGLFSEIIKKFKPSVIYLPFKDDVHSDHQKVFKACYSCTKVFRYPFIKKILMMETLSETDFAPALTSSCFAPNYYVDISKFFYKKLKALEIYKSEIGAHPFPRSKRSVEALGTLRGCQTGVNFAEAFVLLKSIE